MLSVEHGRILVSAIYASLNVFLIEVDNAH